MKNRKVIYIILKVINILKINTFFNKKINNILLEIDLRSEKFHKKEFLKRLTRNNLNSFRIDCLQEEILNQSLYNNQNQNQEEKPFSNTNSIEKIYIKNHFISEKEKKKKVIFV